MAGYTQYLTAPDNTEDEAYMVVSEDYADIGDLRPIPGTYRVVSRNHTLAEATNMAVAKQRASYGENRKAQPNAQA